MSPPVVESPLRVPESLLRRVDSPGPRYTSYPTADRFVEAFGPAEYQQALQERAWGARIGASPLSLYVHIPFCESVCYYCACNKVVTKHHDKAAEYLRALETEIDLHLAELGAGQPVVQLHLGGGTPTFLSDAELERLMSDIRRAFKLLPHAELSIEVDPRTASEARLAHLRALGFNRNSFGVQDFDPDVQKAVHRVQSFESVQLLMDSARSLGFVSTNVDLIYGLPLQTASSFERTIERVIALQPGRIALYSYAHLPQRFKPQRRIDGSQLPSGETRLQMLGGAISSFLAGGYDYVGMDHFAKPDDSLAQAKRKGLLHRNFQGYSTLPDCDIVALGVSAIGRIGSTFSQNAKTLEEYQDAMRQRRFATVRGLSSTRDDLVRRAVIMAIMCQGRVEFESIELAHLIRMREYFAPELERLESLAADGLVVIDDDAILVTEMGWYFVRGIAMVFDRYIQADRTRAQFSRII
jgi:oxygen-independent coproporphyrinogen-3 oxidase